MKSTIFAPAIVLSLLIATGCKTEEEIQRGALGESCTRRDDCADGLACVENRCVASSAASNSDAGTGPTASGGKEGESCTRRADCRLGLGCYDQICVQEDSLMGDAAVPTLRGQRGETCSARNDCGEGLACVAGRCREHDIPIAAQSKHCFRVQCDADADCCEQFVPPSYCATYETECMNGNTLYCNYYEQNCRCRQGCENSLCVTVDKCSDDTGCNFSLPFCVNQKCVQCKSNTDCAESDAQCVDGVCRTGCERNEECPLFYACQSGRCVDVGCSSDRECYFDTGDPRSKCVESECLTPCQNDAECPLPFNVCENSRCVFVGCESNEECRVYLNLENQQGTDTAVCAPPR